MSNRKTLKKNIYKTMDLLYADCLFYQLFVVDADQEAAEKVMSHIDEIQEEFIKRVNVNEGREVKGRVKAYYKKLETDFRDEINKIAKEIEALGE